MRLDGCGEAACREEPLLLLPLANAAWLPFTDPHWQAAAGPQAAVPLPAAC